MKRMENSKIFLEDKIFNDKNYNDFVVVEGMECYRMVIQINSDDEIDFTVYDYDDTELDGGVYEANNITYKELFEFAGFDKFNEYSKLIEGNEKDSYLDYICS